MKLDIPLKGFLHAWQHTQDKCIHLSCLLVTVVNDKALDTQVSCLVKLILFKFTVHLLLWVVKSWFEDVGTRWSIVRPDHVLITDGGVIILQAEVDVVPLVAVVVLDLECSAAFIVLACVLDVVSSINECFGEPAQLLGWNGCTLIVNSTRFYLDVSLGLRRNSDHNIELTSLILFSFSIILSCTEAKHISRGPFPFLILINDKYFISSRVRR